MKKKHEPRIKKLNLARAKVRDLTTAELNAVDGGCQPGSYECSGRMPYGC